MSWYANYKTLSGERLKRPNGFIVLTSRRKTKLYGKCFHATTSAPPRDALFLLEVDCNKKTTRTTLKKLKSSSKENLKRKGKKYLSNPLVKTSKENFLSELNLSFHSTPRQMRDEKSCSDENSSNI